jgi:hypothetical protein
MISFEDRGDETALPSASREGSDPDPRMPLTDIIVCPGDETALPPISPRMPCPSIARPGLKVGDSWLFIFQFVNDFFYFSPV